MCGSGSAGGRFFAITGRFAAFYAEHAIVGVKDVQGVVCFRIYPADRMNVLSPIDAQ
jgi:hypothetical protein